jgi:cob(I)alamin adenosyltransferase
MEDRRMSQSPRVLIFTGEGKGKTTAALGMAFRAAGHGMRTCVVQFIKADDAVGEVAAASASSHIEIHQTGLGFLPLADSPEFAAHRKAAQSGLHVAAEAVASGRYALVVLDEICLAAARGLVDAQQVSDIVAAAPAEMCLVFTGRHAGEALIALADTVTEMRLIKHGYDAGRPAQDGVER